MSSEINIDVGEDEDVLYSTQYIEAAEVPEGWDPEAKQDRAWSKEDLETVTLSGAVIGNEEEESVVIRLEDGREYSYRRAVERCELGNDYVLSSMMWMTLISNQLPEKAAEIMGVTYHESVPNIEGTDAALREADTFNCHVCEEERPHLIQRGVDYEGGFKYAESVCKSCGETRRVVTEYLDAE